MAPTLVRFYGGTRQDWQAAPWGEACQFYRAIPRIRAAESGRAVPRLDLSADLSAELEKIQAAAEAQMRTASQTPKKKRVQSAADLQEALRTMGIGVAVA